MTSPVPRPFKLKAAFDNKPAKAKWNKAFFGDNTRSCLDPNCDNFQFCHQQFSFVSWLSLSFAFRFSLTRPFIPQRFAREVVDFYPANMLRQGTHPHLYRLSMAVKKMSLQGFLLVFFPHGRVWKVMSVLIVNAQTYTPILWFFCLFTHVLNDRRHRYLYTKQIHYIHHSVPSWHSKLHLTSPILPRSQSPKSQYLMWNMRPEAWDEYGKDVKLPAVRKGDSRFVTSSVWWSEGAWRCSESCLLVTIYPFVHVLRLFTAPPFINSGLSSLHLLQKIHIQLLLVGVQNRLMVAKPMSVRPDFTRRIFYQNALEHVAYGWETNRGFDFSLGSKHTHSASPHWKLSQQQQQQQQQQQK